MTLALKLMVLGRGMPVVEYLVVAGGGRGGFGNGVDEMGGMGGAGGLLQGTFVPKPAQSYAITVGAGGDDSTRLGGDSIIAGVATAKGGGWGGESGSNGANGGSGGGGAAPNGQGGAGTVGQGNAGGSCTNSEEGAGGGGAGGVGGNRPGPGLGGAGVSSDITGTSVTYAPGGTPGDSPASRYGEGGRGAYVEGLQEAGFQGIVIVRYRGPQRATGGTVTTSGGYTIHSFTSSGTLQFTA